MNVSEIQGHVTQYAISPISRENEQIIKKFNQELSAYDRRVYKRLMLHLNSYYIEYERERRVKVPAWL